MGYHKVLDETDENRAKCGTEPCDLHALLGHTALPCATGHTFKSLAYFPLLQPHATFDEAVLHYEVWLVRSAMNRANGQVGKAAQLLGKSRQSLDAMIDQKLAFAQLRMRPRRPYRSSVITKPQSKRKRTKK